MSDTKRNIPFYAAAGLVALGMVIGNADRLFKDLFKDTEPQISSFDDNTWQKEPHIARQEAFQDDLLTFAETVRKSLPPRDKALEQHRAITAACDKFYKAANYGTHYTFYENSQQKARDCLTVVERAAIETKTKYDIKFAELADRYTRTNHPEDVQPPVFVLSK